MDFQHFMVDEKNMNSWMKTFFFLSQAANYVGVVPWILDTMNLKIHGFPGPMTGDYTENSTHNTLNSEHPELRNT